MALLAVSFIVWRVNLTHDVNTKLQAIRAAGLPTSGAELNAYYPAVPDNENAALVMTGYARCGTVTWHEQIPLPDEELAGVRVHEVVDNFTAYVEETA